jgi:hypothetical protein
MMYGNWKVDADGQIPAWAPGTLRGFKSILHPMPYNQSTDIARTDLSSWGSTWLVVRTNFPEGNLPRTSRSKVMIWFWSAFTRELVITNEAILGDISP